MPRGKRQFAIICCLHERKVSVVLLSDIHPKCRTIGNVFLMGEKATKLLEISDNKEELERKIGIQTDDDNSESSTKKTVSDNQSTKSPESDNSSKKMKLVTKQTLDKEIRSEEQQVEDDADEELNLTDSSEDERSPNSFDGIVDTIPFKEVTLRDVMIQRHIYKALKHKWLRQQLKLNKTTTPKMSDYFSQSSETKVEIYPNCKFYLPANTFASIEERFNEEKNWNQVVKETIVEVYGDNIIYFSATGKGTGRPGINKDLFTGLFQWINRLNKQEDPPLAPVSRKKFVDYINHLSSNKRGYSKKKKHVKQEQ